MGKFAQQFRSFFSRGRTPVQKNPRSGTNYMDSVGTGGFNGDPLNVATAYRCVRLLSDSVAALPLHKKEKRDGVMVDSGDHLDYLLSVQPNPWTSAYDFWNDAVRQILMKGNAYIFPTYGSGKKIKSLILATQGTVNHDTLNNTYQVMDINQDLNGEFPEEDVVHLKNMTIDGKKGISVVAYAMRTLGIATAGDREARNKFDTGGTVKGLISIKNDGRSGSPFIHNNEKSAYETAKTLNRMQKEMDIIAVPGEYNFSQFPMSSVEQQFLESRKFTVLEVCRFFGVHPSFVYADTASNYKSAEMANVAFLVNTLNPLLCKIENELRRKLTGEALSKHVTFEFDRTGMYACDLQSRVNYMTKLIGLGRTINEMRKMENLPEVEGGDKPMVSANLKPLDQLIEENEKNNGNDSKEEPLSE